MRLKLFCQNIWYSLCDPRIQSIGRLVCVVSLLLLSLSSFADGSDLLSGTDASAWATLNGTGKKYLYLVEGIIALGSYMVNKKLQVFLGIVAVAIFINVILHFGGQTP